MTFGEVWIHQLRWARTIRVCQSVPYFFSILNNVTLWALLLALLGDFGKFPPDSIVHDDRAPDWIVVMDLNAFPFLLEPSRDSEQSFKYSPSPWLIAQAVLLLCAVMTLAAPRDLNAQEQILVGYDGHAGFQGAIWATKDLGLFEKHGLAGELILIPGSARGMAALLSGSVPFIQGSATAPLAAFLRGGDVAVIIVDHDEQGRVGTGRRVCELHPGIAGETFPQPRGHERL